VPDTISVAILEDVDELRAGLVTLISGYEGFTCAGAFATGEEALRVIPDLRPDVVLMDINLPGMSGIACTALLRQKLPHTPVVMLTVYEDDEKIFQALKAGAVGYLLKKTPPAKLLEAIREVHEGGSPMSNQIARKVIASFQAETRTPAGGETLSPREREILDQLARGLRYREIAEALFISTDTVRTHLRNIYQKLQVRSATEALLKFHPKT
jgi:DNA-binding NarL/FixJ family response regulator